MPSANDRRVKYTKMVLRDSLIKLLKNKPVAQITVKELCETADINRATFYAHYADPQALLRAIEDELVTDINTFLARAQFDGRNVSADLLEQVFSYIRDNSEVCTVLLVDNGDIAFQRNIAGIVSAQCINNMTSDHRAEEQEAEYIYIYASVGCVGLIQRWLSSGMRQSPQQMAALVWTLVMKGLGAF